MTNDEDVNRSPQALKRVRDVVGPEEFRELLERCYTAARERGGWFFFDEAGHLMGDRYQATYLRGLAQSVGMDELAARLNPDEFAPGAFDEIHLEWMRPGRPICR